MNRILACPWQKVVKTEKTNGSYYDKLDVSIITKVSFGECMTNCPFYDPLGDYCRRINKHE